MAKVNAPVEIVTPSRAYKPVGQCIYCGRRATKLSREHIIPFGLAANALVLPAASCSRCAEETRDFETACLRHMWWPFRTHIGAPSRGRDRPEKFRVRTMRVDKQNSDGTIEYQRLDEIDVDPSDYPFLYYAYDFPPPGLLIGRHRDADLTFDTWALIDLEALKRYAPGEGEGIRLGPSETTHFCKMLAKIAHGYAIAELGLGAFDPHLSGYIRGEHLDGEPQWIGGDIDAHRHAPNTRFHQIGWEVETVAGHHYLVVRLRLFCGIGAPAYRVVVGDLKRPLNELPFLTQPLRTIDIKGPLPVSHLIPITQTQMGIRG